MKNKSEHYNNLLYSLSTTNIPYRAKLLLFLAHRVLQLQNIILSIARFLIYKVKPAEVKKILVFRTGSLGDSLCAIPAIISIKKKYPDAEIDIITNAGKANLAGLHLLLQKDVYREIIDYYGLPKRKLFLLLQKHQYDLIIQLPQVDASFYTLLRDLIIFRAIAPRGFGWCKSQIKCFRRLQARYVQFPNEIQRLSCLLQRYGILPFNTDTILHPSENDISYAKRILLELGAVTFENMIAIVVGAKRSQNRWPINYFKQVVSRFSSQYYILLIGANEDNELVQELVSIENVINTCGRLTPLQSAAAMSLCQLTISNDTGPMHLSYAVGTPTIALFSSRDLPGKWYPTEKNNRVFRAQNIPCQACFSESCNNNICMQAIMPSEVIEVAEQLLSQQKL